ncbi:MAG: hypothetical protein IJ165_12820 [Proteobacteria bacterium]|nr:hypothetical protein [Pseudomonadota bacterium]
MHKKIMIMALSACAMLASACSDDNAGSSVKVRCQNEGESYCGDSNNILTCRNGVLENQNCGSSNVCHNGKCTMTCVPGQFKTGCVSDDAISTCSAEGFVETKVCDPGNFCDKSIGICRDESRQTCDPTYISQCKPDGAALTKCIAGVVVSENCKEGEICRNGLCMTAKPCDQSTYTPFCSDSQTYTACQDGYETFVKCEGNTICNGGTCASQCEPGFKGCSEDGWNALSCENGVIKQTPCLGGQTCSDGECKASSDCDPETFVAVCEDGKAKKCDSTGKIVLDTCENGTECYNGTCVTDGPCSPETFKPVCVDQTTVQICGENSLKTFVACDNGYTCEGGICQNFPKDCTTGEAACMSATVVRECKDGAWHARYCDIPKEGCVAGKCVNASEAEKCDANAVATCNGNEVIDCQNGYVVKTACGANQHCDAGTCLDDIVEGGKCDPATFKQQCLDDKNTALCDNSTIIKVSCAEGSCSAGECVPPPCTPASFTPSCKTDLIINVCKNGKVTQESCPANTHCENGTCIDNSTPGSKCDPASFSAICESSNTLISCEGNKVTKKTCPNDKPLCLNGTCIETECDPATYGTQCKEDGKTRLWCNNGFIQELTACPASAPVCLNGTCVECNEAIDKPTCDGSAYSIICQNNHKYKRIPCDYNESCIDGKGCVNKCGEGFKNSCDAQGRRVYCSSSGQILTEECGYQYQCVDGACENVSGTDCLPAKYNNACIENNGSVIARVCNEDTKKVEFINCSSSTRFCGDINGKTSCYHKCTDQEREYDYTWCDVINDNKAYVGKCEPGKDYKGNNLYGVFRRHAFCLNNNSVSCRRDTINGHNGHVVFDYLNCGLMSGSNKTCTSNTCGFASCNTPSATCSNNIATNCLNDPSHNDGEGGNVMTIMNCADVKGTCAIINPDGITRAVCNATFTDGNGKTWSSLGTCEGNVLYRLYWGESANKPIISNMVCSNACVSKTENGVAYAYCE